MEFSETFINTIEKGSRSSSPINQTKLERIVNDWYKKNKRLHCSCTKTKFNEFVFTYFNAFEEIFRNEYAIQSGGGPVMRLLDLFALLLFITCFIYKIQREEVNKGINNNMGMINDAIIQYDKHLNLTQSLSLPFVVDQNDIMNSTNFTKDLSYYTKESMAKYLRTASSKISEECKKPPTILDSIPNIEYLVYKYVPLPTKIGRNLLRTNAEKEKKHQQEIYAQEHECYMLAFKQLEQNKTAEMNQFLTSISDQLIIADERMKEEIKINMYNNLTMAITLAYLAARFYFYKKGTPPESADEVMAIMEQNIRGATPTPLQLRDISPPNSADERRVARLMKARSLVRTPSPPRSRSGRTPLPSQSFAFKFRKDQGGARGRRQTHKRSKTKRSKTKRSISKSKRMQTRRRK